MPKRLALAILITIALTAPAAQAFPQAGAPAAWPIVDTYTIPGGTVTMTADCYGDYGLVVTWDLTATDTIPRRIIINMSYTGHAQSGYWLNITPAPPAPNDPTRDAIWRPEYIGRNARIELAGWIPCDTTIGRLTTQAPPYRYLLARVMHK